MTCGEISENPIYFNFVEKMEKSGSKGEANFIGKCKFCNRTSSIEYINNSLKTYDAENSEKFVPLAQFECRWSEKILKKRGWELNKFIPRSGWKAKSTKSDLELDDIDLTELDWAGYDEDGVK